MSLAVFLYLDDQKDDVFHQSTTHNLSEMAREAGLYETLWHAKGILNAADLADKIFAGLKMLCADPAKYKAYDSVNGWGLYENFIPWLTELMIQCLKYPTAKVVIER